MDTEKYVTIAVFPITREKIREVIKMKGGKMCELIDGIVDREHKKILHKSITSSSNKIK